MCIIDEGIFVKHQNIMPIFLGSDLGSDSIHFTVHRLYVNFVQFLS